MQPFNYSQKLWDSILTQALKSVEDGKCGMYRNIYVPYQVRSENYNKLNNDDKLIFLNGVRNQYWNKNGVHIGNNSNPYKNEMGRITE